MSFDLQIKNGDLQIGTDGDLQKVENTEKLVQDILKIALTPVGGNPFFPGYGSNISKNLIGNAFNSGFTSSIAEDQLRASLDNLINLQRIQANSGQRITAYEMLAAIQDVKVERNQTDPRFFKVIIKALTKAFTPANTSFTVTL